MAKIIGLTGGIGSGKTTIANYIKTLGIPVYNADEEARKISETPGIKESIKASFGDAVFTNGKLMREKLAKIVFNDPEKLVKLNDIIHPAVLNNFKNWVTSHSTYPLLVKEAAILFESGSYKDCDIVITLIAPTEIKIERVIKRDQISGEEVLKRMNNQWTDCQRIEKSDYVIENLDLTNARNVVSKILKKLMIS